MMEVRVNIKTTIKQHMSKPKVYLIGLGAIGASYAAQAADQGFSLSIICDQDRKKRYEASPFIVNGKTYDFNYITEQDNVELADVLLIAVKQHQLNEAIEAVRPFVSSKTIILSLLNGIWSEGIVGEKLATDRVLHAIAVATDGQKQGNVINFSSKGKIIFGAIEQKNKALAEKAQSIMEQTGIITENVPDMKYWFWWKFMTNVGINQTSAVLKAPYGAFREEGPATKIARKAMLEVVSIAKELNVPLTEADPEKTFRIMKTMSGENKSSTLQDIEANRPTEVDIYAAEVIKLGKQFNIPTPANELMYHAIKYFESEYL